MKHHKPLFHRNCCLIVALCTLSLLLLTVATAYAEEAEKTEKVVVSGFGLNPEKAKENAIRNAVEQVIGTYVASESIVKNSQLLKDEILSYSCGYLKETKIGLAAANE